MDNKTLILIKNYIDKKIASNLSGKSAYQIAIDHGFEGTEQEWIDSLSGSSGETPSIDISGKEDINNKVTSISSSSTDIEYPSAKLLYDKLQLKADLISPSLSGTPTAPTANYGTNTDQIATTAFVQQAIKPSIMVSISDIPVNTVITVTATLANSNPEYSVTETLNSSGIAILNLDYVGEYNISYNNLRVRSRNTINISIPKMYTLNGVWSEAVTYTLLIDTTNSNPETACTYYNSNMVKGSSDWDTMPIFKNIRPCVFKNGEVVYYLNPNDWTKKYGSNDASVLTGEDGDVMIEFPKFAYKIKTESGIITVSVSTDDNVIENDSDYTYDAFSRLEEGDLDFFYKGAFKGYIDEGGKLRSIAGVLPTVSKTGTAFRSSAQANGAHYQQSTYAQLKALQCLYLIKYGNRDSQTALGKGVVNTNSIYVTGYNTDSVENISSENSTLSLGTTYPTSNSLSHVRLFGIEDFWGNIEEYVEGISIDNSDNAIFSWNKFSNEEGITKTTTSKAIEVPSNYQIFIKEVIGDTDFGFFPLASGGSTSTYWADRGFIVKNRDIGIFGGRNSWQYNAGVFSLSIYYNSGGAQAFIGGRLSYV